MSLTSDLLQQLARSQAIDRQPRLVSPHTLVTQAIGDMSRYQTSCMLVVEQQQLVGIFTERDVVRITASGMALENVTIQEVMTQNPITLSTQDDRGIFSILYLLRQHQIRHLPLVDESGQVIGVITPNKIREVLKPTDLLKFKLVADVMSSQVLQNSPTTSLIQITQQMVTHRKSCVVITETRNFGEVIAVGIITERDIVKFQVRGLDLAATQAQMVMSQPLIPIKVSESLWIANELMKHHTVRRLVVADDGGRLAGIITQSTILAALDPIEMYAALEIMQQEARERTLQLSQLNEQLQQKIAQHQQELRTRALLEQQLLEQNAQLQKAREAAEAANTIKSAFLATMSHELKTPLHAILGFTQLLQRSLSHSPQEQDYLNRIRQAGEQLLRLITKILDLSKQEAEGITATLSDFELEKKPVSTATEAVTLSRDALADLPAEWLASLHQATIEGDLEQMLALIEQIRDRDERLANDLISLANNLRFRELLALTELRAT